MALIKCPDCGEMISEHAEHCIHCGCPIDIIKKQNRGQNGKEYIYCLVSFVDSMNYSNAKQYYYISDDITVKVGDKAIVPVGSENEEKEVIIQSVRKYTSNYPYPPEQTKHIAKKKVLEESSDFEIENGVLIKYNGKGGNVVIPDCVKAIGDHAFYRAFEDIGITSIVIPDSVDSIGDDAFDGCHRLVEVINLSKLNIKKTSYGLEVLKIKTSGESEIVNKDGYLFYTVDKVNYLLGYTGTDRKLILPSDYNGEKYVINQYAFYEVNLFEDEEMGITSVEIPSSVVYIGKYAFHDCSSLLSVTIGNGVRSIGGNAFLCCGSLTSVEIPDSVTSIGEDAFRGCSSLLSVTIGNGVRSIGGNAFRDCGSLLSITISDCVKTIGGSAFYGCNNLQYNKYHNGLYLGNEINNFLVLVKAKDRNIINCEINNNCKIICASAFSGCLALRSIVIPNSVTCIGQEVFKCCYNLQYNKYYNGLYLGNERNNFLVLVKAKDTKITNCKINNNCKIICADAFLHCSALQNIVISNSVVNIGNYNFVFFGCKSLTKVNFAGTIKEWNSIEKSVFWDYESSIKTILCTDGEMIKGKKYGIN